ncbi:hypothetical protein O0I10_011338 [Lichtheimia ornata]|uniref:RanBD1 domain-containing protein n=1 Tax=Lichtheimia ornata TaxID=688661 RepID=A0AAD7UTV3_9FUNG|nr:uncharacterized protein O0I10_011338 [Lichtheimia ornata]KAJ8653038.1 hypothetical protein O0I10_011338 [Lichtheimia ornata]
MSSPTESISDFDDAASTKKRLRDQSVDPEEPTKEQVDTSSVSTAPKKTKHDDENTTSVRTIRQNLKDMSTADNANINTTTTTTTTAMEDEQQQQQQQQHQPASSTVSPNDSDSELDTANVGSSSATSNNGSTNSAMARFGGSSSGDNNNGWGEFAEDDNEKQPTTTTTTTASSDQSSEKPKYTFGATSGFGTKGWAASQQTTPSPLSTNTTQKHTFGGFSSRTFGGSGTSSTFGSTNAATTTTTAAAATTTASTATSGNDATASSSSSTSTPSFASFANASASPFALAAAGGNTNALSSLPNVLSKQPSAVSEKSDNDENASEASTTADHPTEESESTKVKAIVQQKEVKTGEEDEKTLYQTKAKLYVMEQSTGNWKERGAGTMRINTKETASGTQQTRIVMRADTVFRVILNLPMFEGMKFLIMQDKFVRFAGFETVVKDDGKSETNLVNYALRVANPSIAAELQQQLTACVPH